ncbi:Werner syndrome ATP-dependent helicase homolog [Paramuricea clavata]|uniref:DNA 3'-5' helicase n=1 Tax=Paramuricea clavata TaxID=317549 RepID=A0A6S7KH36_PARCT|nr:Werner syndrome ATP-dependent helicase homolog [Paramuricea clavata]
MEVFDFLQCLHFAVNDSNYYSSVILKPKQVLCLEAVYLGKDLLAILLTGYGKSIIFHLLPSLLSEKNRRSSSLPQQVLSPVVVVISPLNSLMNDQLRRINTRRDRAAVLSLRKLTDQAGEHTVLDKTNIDDSHLKNASYEFIFAHPEACLSAKQGVALFQSDIYKRAVLATE